MGADGDRAPHDMAAAENTFGPLALLHAWLACRGLGLEWQGHRPAATTVWATLLLRPCQGNDGVLGLELPGGQCCAVHPLPETDWFAWERLLSLGVSPEQAPRPLLPNGRRDLLAPCLGSDGRLRWTPAAPRCPTTRRWIAHDGVACSNRAEATINPIA